MNKVGWERGDAVSGVARCQKFDLWQHKYLNNNWPCQLQSPTPACQAGLLLVNLLWTLTSNYVNWRNSYRIGCKRTTMNPHKSTRMTKVEQIMWGFTLCPVLFIWHQISGQCWFNLKCKNSNVNWLWHIILAPILCCI